MILLVRHAPTPHTLKNLIQTYTDDESPIVNLHAKTKFLNFFFEQAPFDMIHASPMKRVKETIQQLELDGLDIRYDVRLEEINIGRYDGTTKDEFIRGPIWDINRNLDPELIYDSIENFLCGIDLNKKHLIFSHGLRIKYFINFILQQKLSFETLFNDIIIKPLSIVVLDRSNLGLLALKGIYNNE